MHEQHQPAANQRRRSYEDRITTMKPRSTQSGMRENTASSRQHAPRPVFNSASPNSHQSSTGPGKNVSRISSVPDHSTASVPFDNAAQNAATGGEEPKRDQLLTVREVASLLHVPISWVYERTRKRGAGQLPHVKLGKYLRFEESTVTEFIREQRCA